MRAPMMLMAGTAGKKKKRRGTIPHFGSVHDGSLWTGPVERRDPDVVRQQSVQLTWMCQAAHCRRWTSNGAYLGGRCNWCGRAR